MRFYNLILCSILCTPTKNETKDKANVSKLDSSATSESEKQQGTGQIAKKVKQKTSAENKENGQSVKEEVSSESQPDNLNKSSEAVSTCKLTEENKSENSVGSCHLNEAETPASNLSEKGQDKESEEEAPQLSPSKKKISKSIDSLNSIESQEYIPEPVENFESPSSKVDTLESDTEHDSIISQIVSAKNLPSLDLNFDSKYKGLMKIFSGNVSYNFDTDIHKKILKQFNIKISKSFQVKLESGIFFHNTLIIFKSILHNFFLNLEKFKKLEVKIEESMEILNIFSNLIIKINNNFFLNLSLDLVKESKKLLEVNHETKVKFTKTNITDFCLKYFIYSVLVGENVSKPKEKYVKFFEEIDIRDELGDCPKKDFNLMYGDNISDSYKNMNLTFATIFTFIESTVKGSN